MNRRQKLFLKLQKMQKEALKNNQEKIGKPEYPSDEEAREKWEKRISEYEPRTFYYVLDFKTLKTIYTHNTELVFGHKKIDLQVADLLSLYHPNQTIISTYQSHKIQELLFDYKGKVVDKNFFFTSQRAIKDKNSKYWNARFIGTTFQFDKQGYMTSFLIKWNLFSPYNNEGIDSDFYYEGEASEQNIEMLKDLKKKFRAIKFDTIYFLDFTNPQIEVIKQWLLKEATINNIAEHLRIAPSTVKYHNRNILEIGKELFPINNFEDAKDVALYLEQQNII